MIDLQGYGHQLAVGLQMTVQVAATSVLVGLVLGLLGASAKLSPYRAAQTIAGAYTTLVRGVPELILLLILFFGGTIAINKIAEMLGSEDYVEIDAFTAGVLTLGFVFGAYATEVFRGAIQAVPVGQVEAARAIGMPRVLVFRRVVLPQVWRFALPGLGNLWLVLLKDTALISVIGLDELMRKTFIAAGSTRDAFTFYGTAALIYLGLTIVSMIVLEMAERRVNRGVRRV